MPKATYQVMESIFKPNIAQIENLVKHISWSTGFPYYIGRQALGIEMQKLASIGSKQQKPTIGLITDGEATAFPVVFTHTNGMATIIHPQIHRVSLKLNDYNNFSDIFFRTLYCDTTLAISWLGITAHSDSRNIMQSNSNLQSSLYGENNLLWSIYFAWVCNNAVNLEYNELSLAARLGQKSKLDELLTNARPDQLISALREAVLGGNDSGAKSILGKYNETATKKTRAYSFADIDLREYVVATTTLEGSLANDVSVPIPTIKEDSAVSWETLEKKRIKASRVVIENWQDLVASKQEVGQQARGR